MDDHSEEPAEANTADPGASQPEGLNEREQALWDVLASGSSDADAALETGYAEKTVQRKRTDWGI